MIFPTALAIITSIIVFMLVMDNYIEHAVKHGICGLDNNKPTMTEVAEGGGIIIMFAYLIGLSFFLLEVTNITAIFAVFATSCIAAFLGLLDDVIPLRWRVKFITPLVAAIPLIALEQGNPILKLGYIGIILVGDPAVNLGILYFIIFIPFVVTGLINATNMVAGFNGMEAANTLTIAGFCCIASYMTNNDIGMAILIPLLPALLLFLNWNKYPAKIFPGDVGAHAIGAILACWAIIADMERFLLICLIPYFAHLVLWLRGRIKHPKKDRFVDFKHIDAEGKMTVSYVMSLATLIIYLHPNITEEEIVIYVWMLTALSCCLSLLILFLGVI
jgi:UDP-N-acetylglucosamine--dolichyl-phosphate N-acetylglucosaminephosphotransferase